MALEHGLAGNLVEARKVRMANFVARKEAAARPAKTMTKTKTKSPAKAKISKTGIRITATANHNLPA